MTEAADRNARIRGKGFLALLRRLERQSADKPRIGQNRRLRDEVIRLGQDPYLENPDSELSDLDLGNRPSMRFRGLGLLGPHGALPLNTTEEVLRWLEGGDDAFVHFTDIFTSRFQQLYFRGWADARPIAQFDRPDEDRFRVMLMALCGLGTPAYAGRGSVEDINKAALTGLIGGRVRSAARLREALQAHLGAAFEIEEHVPLWMAFEPDATNRIGQRGASLGRDCHIGARTQSVNDKIRVHVRLPDAETYADYLPGGPRHEQLCDLIDWYLGKAFEVEVALYLPRKSVRPAQLGTGAQLGWTTTIAPENGDPDEFIPGARYALDHTVAAPNAA